MIEFELIDLWVFSFDNEFNIFPSLYYQIDYFVNDEMKNMSSEDSKYKKFKKLEYIELRFQAWKD